MEKSLCVLQISDHNVKNDDQELIIKDMSPNLSVQKKKKKFDVLNAIVSNHKLFRNANP